MPTEKTLAVLLAAIVFPVTALAGESGGGPAEPLGDLVAGTIDDGGSWPSSAFSLAGAAAFTATDPWHGEELRVVDGIEPRLLEDLWPGRAGSVDSPPIRLGSSYYLSARDGVLGTELWRLDAGGTEFVPVVDLCPGSCSGVGPAPPAVAGGLIFFSGDDGSGAGREPAVSDGTAEGTRVVADVCPGSCSAVPTGFTEWNGGAYFAATGPDGRDLWVSDGTAEGTRRVVDLCVGCDDSPRNLTPWNDHLYFVASGPSFRTGLWRTDGTTAGTEPVIELSAHSLTPFLGRLYFLTSGSAWRLRATDGTPGGTVPVSGLPYGFSTNVRRLAVAAGKMFLSVRAPVTDAGEIWVYDGSSSQLLRGGFPHEPLSLSAVGDRVAFEAADAAAEPWRREPWISDGTPSGTRRLADVWTGPGGTAFTEVDGRIHFSASSGIGAEPWVSDGTPAGTHQLAELWPARPAGFTHANVVSLGERVVFGHRVEPSSLLWASDGTAAGTELLLEWPHFREYAGLDGRLYVVGSPDGGAAGLWKIGDGGGAPELLAAVGAVRLTPAAGALWFSTRDDGQQLWTTDGTAAGTRLVVDVNPGYVSSGPCPLLCPVRDFPRDITAAGGSLFFVAFEDGEPVQLWVSDGSAAGTVPVHAFPGSGNRGPAALTAHAGGVVFRAFDPATGTEPWWSDGTPGGTAPVADFVPGEGSSDPREFTPLGDATLFVVRDPGVGDRLWRIDGAPPAPTLVSDLVADGRSSQVGELLGDGSRVFFPLYHHSTGRELWTSDGTPGGTFQVVDLRPGRAGSYPDPLAFAGGRLFFAADDGVSGLELWVTDGTATGTSLVEDLTPGPEATQPDWAAVAGERLVFFGEDRARGLEPWGLDAAAVGLPPRCEPVWRGLPP